MDITNTSLGRWKNQIETLEQALRLELHILEEKNLEAAEALEKLQEKVREAFNALDGLGKIEQPSINDSGLGTPVCHFHSREYAEAQKSQQSFVNQGFSPL